MSTDIPFFLPIACSLPTLGFPRTGLLTNRSRLNQAFCRRSRRNHQIPRTLRARCPGRLRENTPVPRCCQVLCPSRDDNMATVDTGQLVLADGVADRTDIRSGVFKVMEEDGRDGFRIDEEQCFRQWHGDSVCFGNEHERGRGFRRRDVQAQMRLPDFFSFVLACRSSCRASKNRST